MSCKIKNLVSLKNKSKIVATTAYDYNMAKIADKAGIDILLVGDSVGTTQLGFESTVSVTLDMMIHHTSAVSRAKPSALVVSDLPFGYNHDDYSSIFSSARKLIQLGGAEAIKIEGGAELSNTIIKLVKSGIPILGHIGLLPQKIKILGRYRKFGKSKEEFNSILSDALDLEAAGCFAIVGEMLDTKLSKEISSKLKIPLIGIGSGPFCDGQILVSNDLLGFSTEKVPNFVKPFSNLSEIALDSFYEYRKEVQKGVFPSE